MALTEEEAAVRQSWTERDKSRLYAAEQPGAHECDGVGTVVQVEFDPNNGQPMVRCPSCPTWLYVQNVTAWVPVHFREPKVNGGGF